MYNTKYQSLGLPLLNAGLVVFYVTKVPLYFTTFMSIFEAFLVPKIPPKVKVLIVTMMLQPTHSHQMQMCHCQVFLILLNVGFYPDPLTHFGPCSLNLKFFLKASLYLNMMNMNIV